MQFELNGFRMSVCPFGSFFLLFFLFYCFQANVPNFRNQLNHINSYHNRISYELFEPFSQFCCSDHFDQWMNFDLNFDLLLGAAVLSIGALYDSDISMALTPVAPSTYHASTSAGGHVFFSSNWPVRSTTPNIINASLLIIDFFSRSTRKSRRNWPIIQNLIWLIELNLGRSWRYIDYLSG